MVEGEVAVVRGGIAVGGVGVVGVVEVAEVEGVVGDGIGMLRELRRLFRVRSRQERRGKGRWSQMEDRMWV